MTIDWTLQPIQTLITRMQDKGITKITPAHCEVSPKLVELAEYYVNNYDGTFSYVKDLQGRLKRYGKLTNGQAAGALNCLVNDYKYHNKPQFKMPEAKLPTIGQFKQMVDNDPTLLDRMNSAADNVASLTNDQNASIEAAQLALKSANPVTPKCHNGTYTIVLNETGEYRTIRLVPNKLSNAIEGSQIAQYLSGADNESQYTGFAFVLGDQINYWKAANNKHLRAALTILLQADTETQIDYGQAYAIESKRCWYCGKKLTVPASLHRGVGPICAEKLGLK